MSTCLRAVEAAPPGQGPARTSTAWRFDVTHAQGSVRSFNTEGAAFAYAAGLVYDKGADDVRVWTARDTHAARLVARWWFAEEEAA